MPAAPMPPDEQDRLQATSHTLAAPDDPDPQEGTRRRRSLASAVLWGLIGLMGVLLALSVRSQTAMSLDQARHNYRTESRDEALHAAESVDDLFVEMYQGLRTVARLPGVRSIDRYAQNFSADSRTTVQEIYNNLYTNVAVSELYIVPVDLEPDEIDPNTGEPQEPITTFDEFIVGRNADQDAHAEEHAEIEEIEIHEYRLMRKQLSWMREHFPHESNIEGLDFPAVSGPAVSTCDNSQYSPSNPDELDRSGLIYSVPFYGTDGNLKGCISAVVLIRVFAGTLPGDEFVVRHKEHGVLLTASLDERSLRSRRHVESIEPDPTLLYSEVIPLNAVEGVGEWKFWVGYDDARFWARPDVIATRRVGLIGYMIAIMVTVTMWGIAWLAMRHYRTIRHFVTRLEHQVSARTVELELQTSQLREEVVERTRSETLITDQNRVLELLATGRSIETVLRSLAETVERYQPGIICTVLLVDGNTSRLRHAAAPSLPATFTDRIDGNQLGYPDDAREPPAYTAHRVIVEDISTDPSWEDLREPALQQGLRACWSQPVAAPDGTLGGAIALYYREPRGPTDPELRLIDGAARLAAVAIQRKRTEQEREELHRALVNASRQAGKAEVATGVLHNVGNSLNSVNTATDEAARRIRALPLDDLVEVSGLVDRHADDLGAFVVDHEQGKLLPAFLRQFGTHLVDERTQVLEELSQLHKYVDHIAQVVNMQQKHARTSELIEPVRLIDIIEEALGISANSLERHSVEVDRAFDVDPVIRTDQHQVVQILVNLINNAKQAMVDMPMHERRISIRVAPDDDDGVRVELCDTGSGIAAEHLPRLFEHGFTTRAEGHGFGLHTSSISAHQLGGSLSAQSDGPGYGATFVLTLPGRCAAQREEAA